MTNEPLGKKYRRLMDSFERHKGSLEEQAKRFVKNPKAELQKIEDHNKKISQIMKIMVKRNNDGIKYEISSKIDMAINLYEENLTDEFFGLHPYERLMILYRKRKQYNDEIRVIKKVIDIFASDQRYQKNVEKYKNRLVKANSLLNKYEV